MRTLQSQIGFCAKAQRAMVVSLLVAAVIFYVFWYRPKDQRLRDLKEQITFKQHDLNGKQLQAATLPIVAREVETLRTRLERFNKKLPRQPELGFFIREITQISQRTSLKKLTVQPGLPRTMELFSELPIALTFEGDFDGVFQFLRQAEDMQRLTRVRSISIKAPDPKSGQVEVQLSMNIYFAEG